MPIKDEEIRSLNAQVTELTRRITAMAMRRNSDLEQVAADANASACAIEAATRLETLVGQLSEAKQFDKGQHRIDVLSDIEARINELLVSKSSLTKEEIDAVFKSL